MKITVHIPTEQYGFVEAEFDSKENDTAQVYSEIKDSFTPKSGLADKDFNRFLETQLLGGNNQMEEYVQMNPKQQEIVQIIKKTLKRIAAHDN